MGERIRKAVLSGDPFYCHVVSAERRVEIERLFRAATTTEERRLLVDRAPEADWRFFLRIKNKIESLLATFNKNILDHIEPIKTIAATIGTKYPELQIIAHEWVEDFEQNPLESYKRLLKLIYATTDLCLLEPDSCFTWAREKLALVDVTLPDVGIEHFVSPTRSYLEKVV